MAEECRSCQAQIWWAEKSPPETNPKTGRLKTMPINADSIDDPKGNIEVWTEDVIPSAAGKPAWAMYFRYLNQAHPEPDTGHHRAVSHFATCPQSGQWRSRDRVPPGPTLGD